MSPVKWKSGGGFSLHYLGFFNIRVQDTKQGNKNNPRDVLYLKIFEELKLQHSDCGSL